MYAKVKRYGELRQILYCVFAHLWYIILVKYNTTLLCYISELWNWISREIQISMTEIISKWATNQCCRIPLPHHSFYCYFHYLQTKLLSHDWVKTTFEWANKNKVTKIQTSKKGKVMTNYPTRNQLRKLVSSNWSKKTNSVSSDWLKKVASEPTGNIAARFGNQVDLVANWRKTRKSSLSATAPWSSMCNPPIFSAKVTK